MKFLRPGLYISALATLSAGYPAGAQEVTARDLVTETRERVLRIETLLPAPPAEVWKAFSTEEGLRKWAAPVVALDLRTGGSLATNYNKDATIGGPGTIRLGITHYLERELITFRVTLTARFPEKIRQEDGNLQEIIQLVPAPGDATRVISSMVGWGTGKEWDETYAFFSKGNLWTYRQLAKCFPAKKSP